MRSSSAFEPVGEFMKASETPLLADHADLEQHSIVRAVLLQVKEALLGLSAADPAGKRPPNVNFSAPASGCVSTKIASDTRPLIS